MYMERVRGFKLIDVSNSILNGDLIDLGNGILGFYQTENKLEEEKEYAFKPQGRMVLFKKEHF